jgi:Asp-tRNA(Asn)/Glu-tRNA(Gln) amidotransferase B subunit
MKCVAHLLTPHATTKQGMIMQWEVVIGFETHAQLKTNSKIFSGSSIQFGAEPNTQASPVDLALPGVLPVMNKGAVEKAIQFGLAVGAVVAPESIFARKNYFIPICQKAIRSVSLKSRWFRVGLCRAWWKKMVNPKSKSLS